MDFIKNHLSLILISIILILTLFLLYRVWLKSKLSFVGISVDSYIQIAICTVLFLTFLVLSVNLVFLNEQISKQQKQIELTQVLNRPICGVTKVNLFGNPATNKRVIKTDVDQRIDPTEYLINFVMLNSGKYPAQKVLYRYECVIPTTKKQIISGPEKAALTNIVLLPGHHQFTEVIHSKLKQRWLMVESRKEIKRLEL